MNKTQKDLFKTIYYIVCEFCSNESEIRFDISKEGALPMYCPFCGEEQAEDSFAEIDIADSLNFSEDDTFDDSDFDNMRDDSDDD